MARAVIAGGNFDADRGAAVGAVIHG
jgi:hypothetical protein